MAITKFKEIMTIYVDMLVLALSKLSLLQMGVLLWQHLNQCRPQNLPKFGDLVSATLVVAMAALLCSASSASSSS